MGRLKADAPCAVVECEVCVLRVEVRGWGVGWRRVTAQLGVKVLWVKGHF